MAWLISGAGLLSIGVFGVAILVDGGGLLRLFYGPAFARYAPAARVMAVGYVVSGLGLGPILTIKATRRTRALFRVQLLTLVVSVAAVVVLATLDGVTGAAAATLFSAVANVSGLLWCQRAARRSITAEKRAPVPAEPTPAASQAGA